MKKWIIFAVLMFNVSNAHLFAARSDTILVAGFKNTGAAADDNVSIAISKSLISLLARVPGVKVIDYDKSMKVVEQTRFFQNETYDTVLLDDMGLSVRVKTIVYGDFNVNNATQTISLRYYIYDVNSGEVILSRNYEGPAGMDIFDSVDEIVKKVAAALVGSDVDLDALAAQPPAAVRFTPANTIVVPSAFAVSVGTSVILYFTAQAAIESYNANYDAYLNATVDREAFLSAASNDYRTIQTQQIIQYSFYGVSAALLGLEAYLLFRKPPEDAALMQTRFIATPNYLGVAIRF